MCSSVQSFYSARMSADAHVDGFSAMQDIIIRNDGGSNLTTVSGFKGYSSASCPLSGGGARGRGTNNANDGTNKMHLADPVCRICSIETRK
ncbi:hypothetical protein EVAR_2603_1 [Eumeta japonica]|uniref:Uncharacterized protein n=1 Tax=Eumeta variegata TaxID=151549 RepID=A0A4C1SME6_EUMVA|nr:hypothetical protein EVAR_2603_1 [Eumeta japonica]